MKIYDVTVPISNDVPIYKGDSAVRVESFAAMANGDSANVSSMCFGVHTATHVDAPNHFIEGTRRVDELDLAKLIGPCRVIEVPEDVTLIEPEHLGDLNGVERVLFKTRNSHFWSTPEDGFPRRPLGCWRLVTSNLLGSTTYPSRLTHPTATPCISLCWKKRSLSLKASI